LGYSSDGSLPLFSKDGEGTVTGEGDGEDDVADEKEDGEEEGDVESLIPVSVSAGTADLGSLFVRGFISQI